jgi:tRNA (guanine6-N2)-methyltransferase
MEPVTLKLAFIPGLQEIVLEELSRYPSLRTIEQGEGEIFCESALPFAPLRGLKSVGNAYLVKKSKELNPYFLSRHKSVLGELVQIVLHENNFKFRSFKLSCAGSDSPEIQEIKRYISETYKLAESEDADLKITIGKSQDLWELDAQAFARPLSLRDYKVANLKGALNPTIAYAMNVLCDVQSAESYLNVCSGSATLLIEAGLLNPKLKLVGFDIDGKHNALAVQNIKKAGLIKSIQLKTADLFAKPDFGMFDVIASDLPFGMLVSKDADLEKLYRCFVEYCEEKLIAGGKLVVYTTEHELLEKILKESKFDILKTLDLTVSTNSNAYLYPKVFVCGLAA